ncbi:MAG: GNAT family N-acetyltransferase [Ktedonobacterales bacterium]|nr:GNAT family N-acetyltransferase [Ktedonobacterales bacterium]
MLDHLHRLARSVEENWCAAWASLGAVAMTPRTVVERGPEYLRVYTPGEPDTLLNMVMRYAAPGPVRAVDIERVLQPYRRHHLPTQWWLMLGMEPPGLRERLAAAGMQSWGGAAAMAREMADGAAPISLPPLEGDVTLGRLASRDDTAAALGIICDVFSVSEHAMARWTTRNPAFALYLARLGGQPVAALGILRHEDVAGVYHVATLPWARRRGLAGHLLTHALRDAQAAGCLTATLTATPEARSLYERLGFRAVGVMEQWMPGSRLMWALCPDA